MAHAQLHLIPAERPWQLDESTRRLGRAGLERARRALAQASEPSVTGAVAATASTPPADDHTLAA
jgi:hypothetical protein